MKRQHPIAIIGYTSRYFWMLLFPLIRGLATIRLSMESLQRWAKGAGWDLFIVAAMVLFAVGKWFLFKYKTEETHIRIETGLIPSRSTDLPYRNICAVSASVSPLYKFLGLVKLRMDTDAPCLTRRRSDVVVVMEEKECAAMLDILDRDLSSKNRKISIAYRVRLGVMAAFSFFFSNAVSGTLLVITGVSGSAAIIGEKLEAMLFELADGLSDALSTLLGTLIRGISPVGVKISVIIGIGFLISFAGNIMRLGHFRSERRGNCIRISSGLVTKRVCIINAKKINMVDMRQNLLMKLLGLTSVHISCTGYGKQKNEIPVFIPICMTPRRADRKRTKKGYRPGIRDPYFVPERILPEFAHGRDHISTRSLYCWRMICIPAFMVMLIPLAGLCGAVVFPEWYDLILFFMVILEIPSVWLLLVKAVSFMTNGFDIRKRCVCAKYSSFYMFHTISVPFERLAQIRISQNLFQRFNRSCDVHIYTAAERMSGQVVRSMPSAGVQRLIREKM